MRAFTWFTSSACLERMIQCALVQFPYFTEEQTETHREEGPAQISKGAVELGLEPRFLDSQPGSPLSFQAISIHSCTASYYYKMVSCV